MYNGHPFSVIKLDDDDDDILQWQTHTTMVIWIFLNSHTIYITLSSWNGNEKRWMNKDVNDDDDDDEWMNDWMIMTSINMNEMKWCVYDHHHHKHKHTHTLIDML